MLISEKRKYAFMHWNPNQSHETGSDPETDDESGEGHSHTPVDQSLLRSKRGIQATIWSFAGLMITALLQVGVLVWYSNSVALLADTIHNFADALTALPLYVAFQLHQRKPSKRYSYGYGRFEDLAGLIIVVIIFITAGVAAYESVHRFLHPVDVQALPALAIAAVVGFLGNEAVALYRISVGEEIGSAALIADGKHSRIDGLTSLAVLFGALGIWLSRSTGLEWLQYADPVVGGLISLAILHISYETAREVIKRLMDGVDPEVLEDIRRTTKDTDRVEDVTEVRARWNGHDLRAEVNIAVDGDLPVEEGHDIAKHVQHNLLHDLPFLTNAVIHVDPLGESGEKHHVPHSHSTS